MPVTDTIILSIIVAAFAVFALTLAWADYRTRNIRPIVRPTAPKLDAGRPVANAPIILTVAKGRAERTPA